jgi:hypothetical protein
MKKVVASGCASSRHHGGPRENGIVLPGPNDARARGTATGSQLSFMNVLDLIKATIACGLSAFLIYSFPIVGQVIIIGLLSVLWLGYAHKTVASLRRR